MGGKTIDRGIRELEPGVYGITVSAGRDPVTGRYERIFSTVHGGIRAARTERDRLRAQVADGKNRKTTVTVDRLLDEWLEHLITIGRAPKTIHSYRHLAAHHVRPALGTRPLKSLSARDLDALYRQLIESKRQSTAEHVHRMLRAALNQAVRWDWIDASPAERATAPAIPYREVVVPEPTEIITLIEAAERSERPEMARFLFIAATTGLRRSELCGMRPDLDVNEDTLIMTVRRTLTEFDARGERAEQIQERQPKTRRGVRKMAVDLVTLAVIGAQRDFMASRARSACLELVAGHYLFSDEPDGSRPWKPDWVTSAFRRLTAKTDLGHLTLHTLRKFMSTRMIDAGVDVALVAKRGGHDVSVMLRHYTGVVTESDHRAAAAVAALIAPRSPQ